METFMAYVTLTALTRGIRLRRVRDVGSDMVQLVPDRWGVYYHREGENWHRTWESALARAEDMRARKIKSLKASLAKLEKMQFIEPTKEEG